MIFPSRGFKIIQYINILIENVLLLSPVYDIITVKYIIIWYPYFEGNT